MHEKTLALTIGNIIPIYTNDQVKYILAIIQYVFVKLSLLLQLQSM